MKDNVWIIQAKGRRIEKKDNEVACMVFSKKENLFTA